MLAFECYNNWLRWLCDWLWGWFSLFEVSTLRSVSLASQNVYSLSVLLLLSCYNNWGGLLFISLLLYWYYCYYYCYTNLRVALNSLSFTYSPSSSTFICWGLLLFSMKMFLFSLILLLLLLPPLSLWDLCDRMLGSFNDDLDEFWIYWMNSLYFIGR